MEEGINSIQLLNELWRKKFTSLTDLYRKLCELYSIAIQLHTTTHDHLSLIPWQCNRLIKLVILDPWLWKPGVDHPFVYVHYCGQDWNWMSWWNTDALPINWWVNLLKMLDLSPFSMHISIVLTFLHVSMYCWPTSWGYSMMRKIQPNIQVSDTTAHKSNITKWNPYHNETILTTWSKNKFSVCYTELDRENLDFLPLFD